MTRTSIETKLLVCFVLVVVAAGAAAAYSLDTLRHIRSQMQEEIVGSTARLEQSLQIATGIANMRSSMRGVTLFSLTHNAGPFAKARSAFGNTAAEMRKVIQSSETSRLTAQDRAAIHAISLALDQWVDGFQQFADWCTAGKRSKPMSWR